MSFLLYAAIDVREKGVVRLAQGDYTRETRYARDPFELARDYAAAGAQWLHLVDLDAARAGGYTLSPLLARIKRETPLQVQTGGGVRGETDVERILGEGADRVVVGSMAVEHGAQVADWIKRFGAERIAVALDARCDDDGCWWPATHGWTRPAETTLESQVKFYSGVGLRHLLCTDIDRDGMMAGPNLELYALVRDWSPTMSLQASGGARDDADIGAARRAGCAGIVLGRALVEGGINLDLSLRWQTQPC